MRLYLTFFVPYILLSTCWSMPAEEHPSEASLKLAREILSYYKQNQFFPYDPHPRPHQAKEAPSDEVPSPRALEGSLDPWTVQDDCLTLESNDLPDQLRYEEPEYLNQARSGYDYSLDRAAPKCGTPANDRIIGGQETQRGDFPWTVALEMSWGFQFCGGSLINEKFVLTASHCLSWGRDVLKSRVLIGGYNLDNQSKDGSVYRNIKRIKLHIKYNSTTTDYDVALIELDEPVTLGGQIRTICLPEENSVGDLVGDQVVVAGWGKTEAGKPSNVLRSVQVKVIDNKVCQYMYAPNPITPRMLCAGDEKGGKDSCQGDSGGPLMKKGANGQWTQVGIVSFGIGCGQPKYPGVYTRLSVFIDWISRHSRIF